MILSADSESPDQTARMRSLIWAFAARIPLRHTSHGSAQFRRFSLQSAKVLDEYEKEQTNECGFAVHMYSK